MAKWLENHATELAGVFSPDVRIAVIHPHFLQQHVYLVKLLEQETCLYAALRGDELSVDAANAQIQALLGAQGFSDWQDIKYLVLDEADRFEDKALGELLRHLLGANAHLRIVVMSRVVPASILAEPALRSAARFLPTNPSVMLTDYTQRESRAHLLEVKAFGTGQVFLNGRPVDQWDGVLPRSLFFYFIDRGMTTRDEIFSTFWPDLSVREATNVFHVTKRKISEILGMDLTVYWSGFYRLSPDVELCYDTVLFSEAVQDSAVAADTDALVLLQRAVALYRSEFLTSIDMEWAERRRRELRQTYAEALVGLAKSTERSGLPEESLGFYLRAAATNPQREDLARSIMNIYRQIGRPKDALETYARLERELESQLGVAPAPQLQELAEMINAEMVR